MIDRYGKAVHVGDKVLVACANRDKAILREGTVIALTEVGWRKEPGVEVRTDVRGTKIAVSEQIAKVGN